MQPEDILRIREAQEANITILEDEQRQLIHELKQTIKRKSVIPTKQFNSILQQAVQLIKNS